MRSPTAYDLVVSPRGLRFMGRYLPCTIGRNGITDDKKEGDLASPKGVHNIVDVLYRPDRIAQPSFHARPIRVGDLWSDASGQADYNHLVRAPYSYSHETLRRSDPVYDLVIVTDWNWPDAVAGKGSAIFIHQWRRPGYPTAGCVALRRADLYWVATNLRQQTRLIIL